VATGMVEQKEEIILWVKMLQNIHTVFQLKHHVGVIPIAFTISTIFKCLYERGRGKRIFVSVFLSHFNCCLVIVVLHIFPSLAHFCNAAFETGKPNPNSLD
jgi:hypothetical protein